MNPKGPPWRSMLFVPGSRPDRFAKALAAGADAVCLDLEDSVAPAEKAAAREQVRIYLDQSAQAAPIRAVRINPLDGAAGLRDLLALAEIERRPGALLIPKVESPEAVRLAANVLAVAPVPIVALVETVAGLRAADAIARAPGVALLCFGSGDYAAEVGCSMSAEALAGPRAHLTQAAAAAGIACLDGAWLAIDDEAGLRADCARALDLGFCGKPAIHPRQIAAINAAFTPSADAVAEARAVIAAVAAAGGGVARRNGRMLDTPIVRQAERIVALARADGSEIQQEESFA
jgi:(S)-citramalyl-CoA lyase